MNPKMNNTHQKKTINDLALLGGPLLFKTPVSTSNLVKPNLEKFLDYSRLAYESNILSNEGPLVRLLEHRLSVFHGAKFCVAFSNGFWALVLSIKALALKDRSEVIMPSLTYRRLADVVAWVGLKPRFCEIDENTLAISPKEAFNCIDDNTALLLGVHPIINTCDVYGLQDVAEKKGVPLLFDAVESVYETVNGRKVGSFGNAECFSMHASKLINGFEGGYVTTNDPDLALRLSKMRRFGMSDSGDIEMLGLNAKLTEVHAAMGLASLDDLEDQVLRNKERYRTYQNALQGMDEIRLLEFDEKERTSYKTIVVEFKDDWPLSRADTISILNKEGVLARAYYSPALHSKPMKYPFVPAKLPITDKMAERFMLLPCGHLVSNEDIECVVSFLQFIKDNAGDIKRRLHS